MYRQTRFYIRFILALLTKYRKVILGGLIVGSLTFFFLPKIIRLLPPINSTHKIGLVGRYSVSDLPLSIQSKISRGLTATDQQGLAQPAIATDWQATDSGKTYIFTLDSNLEWQDGTPLVSTDIRYGFKDAVLEYPDDQHLVIKLTDPYSPLPTVVSRPVFKFLKKNSFFSQSKLVGVGDYVLKSYRNNGSFLESVQLSPNSPDLSLPPLEYFFYPSLAQARTAFKLGLVDTVENISDLGELESWPNVQIESHLQTDRYIGVFFNTQDPSFVGQSGKNLRLALNYAVDKRRWSNRATGPIGSNSWVYLQDLKSYDQDLNRAKSLLKNVEKVPPELTLTTVITYLSTAEQIKADWEALGLKVNLQVSPEIPSSYQALLIAQAVPGDPDQYNLWHSTQESTNLTHLKNPRIDKLLEDGRKTDAVSERKRIYSDFQKFLLDENPAIFLYYPSTYSVIRK